MYCIECVEQIPDNSKFCAYCGKSQINDKSSIIKHEIEQIIENEKTNQGLQKNKQSLDHKFLKKTMIYYLIWILPHLFILLALSDGLFDEKNMDGSKDFWPFGNSAEFDEIGQYDITEFLFYTIAPLIILIIISMIRSNIKTISYTFK